MAAAQPQAGGMMGGETSRSGKVKGVVIDSGSNQPMEYANIAIFKKRDSTLVTGGITNNRGEFEISGLDYGFYFVEANFIGYQKSKLNDINIIPANQIIDLGKIMLNPATQQIDGVEVRADRQRVEYRVDKKVINVSQDINAAGGTAVDVLENTPSVDVDIEGNVSLRGSSSFTVLIDGKPSVLTGSDALRQIPASAIENIEIITNPSAKYDPDGMAGIINVVMKKNILAGFNGIVNASVGTGDKYRTDLTLNYRMRKLNLFGGFDWSDDTFRGKMNSERQTFGTDTTQFIVTRGNRDFARKSHTFKGGFDWYLTDYSTLTISANVGQYQFNGGGGAKQHVYTLPAFTDRYAVNNNTSHREGDFVSTNVGFQQKFNDQGTHKLDLLFYYSNRTGDDSEFQDEYRSDSDFRTTYEIIERIRTVEDENSHEYRMKLDYVRPAGAFGKLEAGLQSLLDRETEDYRFENFNQQTGGWENNPLFTSAMDFKDDVHAAYLTWSDKPGSFEYMLGLRGEYTNRVIEHTKVTTPYEINRFDLFPTAHVSYSLGEENQLMASYSRRVNRPSGRDLDPFPNYMDQYNIRIGNPKLEPEFTNSWEVGYLKKFGTSFLSVEGFYRVTNNLISRIQQLRDDGIIYHTTDNINKDFSLGTEVMGNFNISKWFLLNASVSVFNYRIDGELNGESIDRESTNYSGRLNGTFKLAPTSRFQVMSIYRGPSVSAQGKSSGMFFSNLSYRQDFLKNKLTATLSLRDVLGTMKMESESAGPNFKSKFKMQRESQVLQLTLSYRINNYKIDRSNNADRDNSGNMNMEMDF